MEVTENGRKLILRGDWRSGAPEGVETKLSALDMSNAQLTADLSDLEHFDSTVNALLLRLSRQTAANGGSLSIEGAPPTLVRMLSLATAVPLHVPPAEKKPGLFDRAHIGDQLASIGDGFLDSLAFLGDAMGALLRSITGRGSMRARELLGACYQSGPDALGIIALTSALVGMILAYLGAAQLQQFGAEIYVADLVAIGMLREMGALMTAVVMAGRTGAAYAAQLSTMQANEEIDAISTLGINPMEFLVAPRIIALVAMMPLLVIFADALGIAGGALVAGSMGVTPLQYIVQLQAAVSLPHFLVGLAKALLFAVLIAIAGCRAGMTAGRNSAGVGRATTDAVVTSVVYLIIADAGVNIICQQLGI